MYIYNNIDLSLTTTPLLVLLAKSISNPWKDTMSLSPSPQKYSTKSKMWESFSTPLVHLHLPKNTSKTAKNKMTNSKNFSTILFQELKHPSMSF